jgi:hypothetical protein
MAGYIGTRPVGGIFAPRRPASPRRPADPGTSRRSAPVRGDGRAGGRAIDLPRRSLRGVSAMRAGRRQGRIGYVVIGIVIAFVLGLPFRRSRWPRFNGLHRQYRAATSRGCLGGEPLSGARPRRPRRWSSPSWCRRATDPGPRRRPTGARR